MKRPVQNQKTAKKKCQTNLSKNILVGFFKKHADIAMNLRHTQINADIALHFFKKHADIALHFFKKHAEFASMSQRIHMCDNRTQPMCFPTV